MNKQQQQLKHLLLQNQGPAIDAGRRSQALALAQQQIAEHPLLLRQPYLRRLRQQIAYISPFTWLAQLALLAFCILRLSTGNQELNLSIFSLLAPLVGLVGFTELRRSFSHNMWELEQACRYSLKQLLGMKLLILGSFDLVLVGVVAAVSGFQAGGLTATILLVLVPFNLANGVYLLLLQVLKKRCTNYVLTVAGIFMALASTYARAQSLAEPEALVAFQSPQLAAAGLVCSLLLMTAAGWLLFHNWNKEDKTKWNFG